jgi:hypothetical protein
MGSALALFGALCQPVGLQVRRQHVCLFVYVCVCVYVCMCVRVHVCVCVCTNDSVCVLLV